MKPLKAVKTPGRKNNPFTAAPAPAKVAAKPMAEIKPAKPTPAPEKAKVAVAPSAVATVKPTRKTGSTATIEAKIDVGFGNTLFLRGEGSGLTWEQGIPLNCVDGSTWQWSGPVEEKLKIKLLLNDAVWAQGEDLVVAPGEKLKISPAF